MSHASQFRAQLCHSLIKSVARVKRDHGETSVPTRQEMVLMAHLMRRAGFGEPHANLTVLASKGYEAVVEELLHPKDKPPIDEELMYRILPGYE